MKSNFAGLLLVLGDMPPPVRLLIKELVQVLLFVKEISFFWLKFKGVHSIEAVRLEYFNL